MKKKSNKNQKLQPMKLHCSRVVLMDRPSYARDLVFQRISTEGARNKPLGQIENRPVWWRQLRSIWGSGRFRECQLEVSLEREESRVYPVENEACIWVNTFLFVRTQLPRWNVRTSFKGPFATTTVRASFFSGEAFPMNFRGHSLAVCAENKAESC